MADGVQLLMSERAQFITGADFLIDGRCGGRPISMVRFAPNKRMKGWIGMRKNFGAKPWVYPLPVLLVGTYDENGSADLMNAAWGGLYDENQVILCLSAGHKTTKNILKKKAFTVSFADAAHVTEADYVGIVSGNKEPDQGNEGRVPMQCRASL